MPAAKQQHAALKRGRAWFAAVAACLLLALSCMRPAHAGIADAPGSDLQVSLITYGPGSIYWERFGHDAIELRDLRSGEAINFNYGVFDFEQKDFLLNFARGRMRYMMDAEHAQPEIAWYEQQGRSVRRQILALTPAQAARLRDFLLWNLRPENLHYDYDYFVDNCTTRVRDALDKATDGALRAALEHTPGRYTYREQTDRLMAGQPWLMLLLDLGLGPFADRPLDRWHDSFIPMTLEHNLDTVRVADGNGGSRPLVGRDDTVSNSRLQAPATTPPDLRGPLALAGLAWAAMLFFAGRSGDHRGARIAFGIGASAYLLFAGLAGLLMTALWMFTAHRAAWGNANLLLFNPLALLLIPAMWKRPTTRFAHAIAWLLTGAAAFALLANLTGLLAQRNLPWILLALPVWLVVLRHVREHVEAGPA